MEYFEERFWRNVDKGKEDECWLWKTEGNTHRYGTFTFKGKQIRATHMSLYLTGRLPTAERSWALHGDTCISRRCVNPKHLRWGSAKENSADRDRLGRGQKGKHWSWGSSEII